MLNKNRSQSISSTLLNGTVFQIRFFLACKILRDKLRYMIKLLHFFLCHAEASTMNYVTIKLTPEGSLQLVRVVMWKLKQVAIQCISQNFFNVHN